MLHQLFSNVSCLILLSALVFYMLQFDLHVHHLLVTDICATFIHQCFFLVYLQTTVSVYPVTVEHLDKTHPAM